MQLEKDSRHVQETNAIAKRIGNTAGAAATQSAQTRKTKGAAILMVILAEIGAKLPLAVKVHGGTIAHHPQLHLKQYWGAHARGTGSVMERHPVHPLVIASTQPTGRAVRIV